PVIARRRSRRGNPWGRAYGSLRLRRAMTKGTGGPPPLSRHCEAAEPPWQSIRRGQWIASPAARNDGGGGAGSGGRGGASLTAPSGRLAFLAGLLGGLAGPEAGVAAAQCQQFLVPALLDDPAAVEHADQ